MAPKKKVCAQAKTGIFNYFLKVCSLEETEKLKDRIETIHQTDSVHSKSRRRKWGSTYKLVMCSAAV